MKYVYLILSDLKNILFRFACSLLRQGMKQILINLDAPGIKELEKVGDKDAIIKVHSKWSFFLPL